MGLSLLISELIYYKKPLVGHNFMYDIGFLYYQFIDDFPDTYELFKHRVHDCFPTIYDTKVIADFHKDKFPCTDLETVAKKATALNHGVVKFAFSSGFANYEESVAECSAGFDAFCVGKVFVIMAKLIETRKSSLVSVENEKSKANVGKVKSGKEEHKIEGKREAKKIKSNEDEEKAKLLAMLSNFKDGPASKPEDKSE
eukprot:TRINITY_DN5036_c0_g1_i7.p1 TRINITY_DN5036_c0_g1~~TRINITY_DN5036_c0_g1_i7.p1  ORF type:complete len:199 (-),score=50.60 TRINITY_DN5036_c0_g1_i7:146-742(-)